MMHELFLHRARPQWGRAVIAAESDDRRHYQFEDGQIRVIAREYYGLMEPVAGAEPESLQRSRRRLRLLLEDAAIDRPATRKPKTTLADQVSLFKAHLPKGFDEESYTTGYRKREQSRKSHIDPSIELASELEAETLDFAAMKKLFASTDLLAPRERKDFGALKGPKADAVVEAARALMDPGQTFAESFPVWLDALEDSGVGATWSVATAFPALIDPKVHVCVRLTAFRAQAKVLLPTIKLDSKAELASYELMQRMAVRVRDALVEAKVPPRDFFDVRNFIWLTLRKDAAAKLAKL